MMDARVDGLSRYVSVFIGVLLSVSCAAPEKSARGGTPLPELHESRAPPMVEARPLPDGRVQFALAQLATEQALRQFPVELAREALADYRESLALVRSLRPVPVGSEDLTPSRRGAWGQQWLHEQFLEGFGPPPYPLPTPLEGSALMQALLLSPRHMPDGVREAATELFKEPAFLAGVATALVFYGLAWAAPEPFFTKAFAVSVTVTLTLAFTMAELVHFGMVCLQLYQSTRGARTKEEIEAAAEHFGKYLGGVGLRVLVFVAGRGVARGLPKPPPGGLLARLAPRRFAPAGGPPLDGATSAHAVVADGSLVVAGVAAGATGQTLRSACKDGSLKLATHAWHHLATNKNESAPVRGGPWTPLFEELFAKAGLSLNASENQVYLANHAGPHPEEYHEEVYRRLRRAVRDCSTQQQCRARLVSELKKLSDEVCTPGTRLHQLVTKP